MRGEPAALEGIKQLQRASLPTIRVCVLAHRPGSSYWPSRCIRRVRVCAAVAVPRTHVRMRYSVHDGI